MFDSQFQEMGNHQFPKTDINFYMLSNNSSSLQPWNKTSYAIKPQSKKVINTIKLRGNYLSFDSHQSSYKMLKRRQSQEIKYQVPLSTHIFNLEDQKTERCKSRKINTPNSVLKARKNLLTQNKLKKQISSDVFWSDNLSNKGFTNCLRHNNLLKLKHQYQNKIKEDLTKKQIQNKVNTPKLSSLQKRHSVAQHQNVEKFRISQFKICSQQFRCTKTNDFIRKPKKVFYVGMRKFLCHSQEKQRQHE